MSDRFPLDAGSIRLVAIISGPLREMSSRMVLDTGASRTVLTWEIAQACGYDPAGAENRTDITTASGFETCPEIVLSDFRFLGRTLQDFPVLCHPLPAELRIDGLVGLDFFRATRLTLDFRIGEVTLEA